ncbi:MAG: response regulator [Alsobacter sp.]
MKRTTISERALILAPHGRDSAIASTIVSEGGIVATICPSLAALVGELDHGAAFVVVTEEAIATADLHALAAWIEDQEEWSDLPFVLLTSRGGGLERNPAAVRHLELLGNVTFLERPFHPTTLISLARSALRGRRRQYEARSRLIALRNLNETLEKRVEDAVAERAVAMAQLHEAQKLETLGQLTGGVAHDINNLLTPITGALDLMNQRYAKNDPRAARLFDGALQSAERAKILVNRLLGFARRQALETRPINVADLLAGMRDLIASSLGPSIELRTLAGQDLPPALADPNQLELAMLNLCVNARDAMEGGGVLTVAAERAVVGPRSATALTPGAYVRVSVIDTGSGMDEATLAKAVEPFFSTKGVGRGTGLGLSMVHGLAAQLGGAFVLTSSPGEGTRADLYLPIAEAPAPPSTLGRPAPLPRMRALSVLLVDDEDLVRRGTAEMLRDLGHGVHEATGGAQALAMLGAGLEVDALVTDYMMPHINGAELAQQARQIAGDLPVLLATGYAGGELDLGYPQLAKPFRQADLAVALDRLVRKPREKVVPLRRP